LSRLQMEVKSDDDRILSEEPEAMRPVCRDMFTPEAGDESGERAKIIDSGSFPAAGTRVKTENHASSPYYADGEPLSLLTALAGGAMAFIAGAGEGGARERTVLESGQPSRRKGALGATPTTPITPSASQPVFCAPAANDHRLLASPFSVLVSAVLGPLGIGLSRYKLPQDPKEVDANNGFAGARGTCQRGKRIRLDPSPWVKSSPAWIAADHAVKAGQDLTRKGRFVMLPRSWQRRSWDAFFIFVQVAFAPGPSVPFCLVHRQDFSRISPKTSCFCCFHPKPKMCLKIVNRPSFRSSSLLAFLHSRG
jgi:hypothetical protein